jgi:hypothetical protein
MCPWMFRKRMPEAKWYHPIMRRRTDRPSCRTEGNQAIHASRTLGHGGLSICREACHVGSSAPRAEAVATPPRGVPRRKRRNAALRRLCFGTAPGRRRKNFTYRCCAWSRAAKDGVDEEGGPGTDEGLGRRTETAACPGWLNEGPFATHSHCTLPPSSIHRYHY